MDNYVDKSNTAIQFSNNQTILSGTEGSKYFCTKKLLGKGSFSKVYRGYIQRMDPIAIKKIRIDKVKKNMNYLESEIKIMRGLKHKNIVNLIDVIWEGNQIYLVLEDCAGGDLKEFISSKGSRPMIEKYVQYYLKQLAEGLRYLRSKNIVHRDLKPQNLLLTKDYDVLKISDFGFAKVIGSEMLAETLCGSPLYMAPEIMNQDSTTYTSKADLWSVGIIMYEMLFARYPYRRVSNVIDLMKKIKKDPIEFPNSPSVSKECMHLIKNLLKKNPLKRIEWEGFFHHPWFQHSHSIRNEKLEKKKLKMSCSEEKQYSINVADAWTGESSKTTQFPLLNHSQKLPPPENDLPKYSNVPKPSAPIPIGPRNVKKNSLDEDTFGYSQSGYSQSLHLNSTSPFVREDNNLLRKFKLNLVDDYSSTESSAITNARQVSEPVLIRHDFDDDDSTVRRVSATTGGYSIGKQVKDFASTTMSLLKDSFRTFQSIS